MKDILITAFLILLAIVIAMTAGLATIAVARYAGAIFGRWAEITYIVVVMMLAVIFVMLLLTKLPKD